MRNGVEKKRECEAAGLAEAELARMVLRARVILLPWVISIVLFNLTIVIKQSRKGLLEMIYNTVIEINNVFN